ncbi:MAG: peptidase S8 [Pseudonocardiales bacterium]|nr:MAG: peptidase S8 [Pseudonocardiales bacterium]
MGAAVGTTVLVASLVATTSAATAAPGGATHRAKHVCAAAPVGYAACHAQVVVDASGKPAVTATPSGYGPVDIQSAYNLAASAGAGTTVAIVDAYNDPTAEADLAVYRTQFRLPACTKANGCLRITNQSGGSKLPRTNAGWATEISLDLDMVSAACRACKILLVEASSASFANLGTAVNYAATQGVAAISNSYGGGDTGPNAAYNHPGIAITASSGDAGYGVESPASFTSVIGVGGTSLTRASNTRGWTETAWSGAGSGCSTLNAKPSWQTSVTKCGGKAIADVSAVADPQTGVSVYDSTSYQGRSGWQVYGGTSASSPIIASVYAMGGNLSGNPAEHTWAAASASGLFDITSGSNGSCPTTIWCTAGTGWDGPTGLGTPNGTTSF